MSKNLKYKEDFIVHKITEPCYELEVFDVPDSHVIIGVTIKDLEITLETSNYDILVTGNFLPKDYEYYAVIQGCKVFFYPVSKTISTMEELKNND